MSREPSNRQAKRLQGIVLANLPFPAMTEEKRKFWLNLVIWVAIIAIIFFVAYQQHWLYRQAT